MKNDVHVGIVSRRHFLVGAAAATGVAILAACGGSDKATEAPKVATVTGAATTAAPTVASKAGGQPKGEWRVAIGVEFPNAVDATVSPFQLIGLGAAETLTRITPQGKLEPWLAESVTNVEPATWRVALRKNLKFWDGSPVTASDVIAAFKLNWEKQPNANGLLSKETQITAVDGATLEFKTPLPAGNFPNALSAQTFVVHKANGTIMTGPYKPVKFEIDRAMTSEAFADYWAGPPPIARIEIRSVPDANTRALALQSGDVDMLFILPPEMVKNFGPEIETTSNPSTRVHWTVLNHMRPPFNDRAVREATALAIDRAALLKVGLDGQGAVATGMFPPNAGVDVVPLQSTDVNRAKQLLDEAGWRIGADGVRAKEGQRLAFTLYSYPQRGELTPIATAMAGQLKPLGYDVQIQQVQNITNQIKDGNFQVAMSSLNTLVTGDPLYMFNQILLKGAPTNYDGYSVPKIESLVSQLRVEVDPAKRQALSRQVQEEVKADVTHLFLVVMPIVTAIRKGKLKGYMPHPSDQYFITNQWSIS